MTINVDGYGAETVKSYKVNIKKPNGVRYMSAKNVNIIVTFGDEEQKTLSIGVIDHKNLADGYSANKVTRGNVDVLVKGVKSNIDKIEVTNIKAYVDLSGLTEGTHEVPIIIDNKNPLVKYVVSSTITVKITKD